jgi:hydrogenase nickel incorporation protein HypA/HybF
MHELSIAANIIEIAEAQARAQCSKSIRKIKLRLGEFTTIVREALEFSFEVARQGTLAEQAALEIETVPLAARCPRCGPVPQLAHEICLVCPACGWPLEIVSGEDLQVEYIEVDECESNVVGADCERRSRG